MDEAHKIKLANARAAAREARKNATDAQIVDERVQQMANVRVTEPLFESNNSEIDDLKAELTALKEKHREKAAHEHGTMNGQENINHRKVSGVAEEIRESLRELLREQLAEVLPEREIARKTVRDSVRPGAVVAHDREGNPVYRKRDAVGDRFAIPEDLRDPNYDLQWVRVSVHGWEDVSNQVNMQENGWRFVPADRPGFEGRFMPKGYKGHIFQDGLALMERPMVLTQEAKDESMRAVRNQSKAQRDQFGLALPDGFTSSTPAAKQYTFARQGKPEPTPANLKPNLQPSGAMDIE